MRFLRRMALLALCMILAATSALASGVRFTLTATVDPAAWPESHRQLVDGLSQILAASSLEGSFAVYNTSFTLDAALLLGEGDSASRTTLHVYGLPSHWGVRSSLLGNTELMVNCAALLPFGQKARDYLGVPLDTAALLIPYTHVHALASVTELLAPLFPQEDGKVSLSREEMDALVTEISRLCDEDPALNRWLEVTGLYRTAKYYCKAYFSIPELLLPSLSVKRSGETLTWKSGLFTLLSIRVKNGTTTCEVSLPTLGSAKATVTQEGDQLTCSAAVDLYDLQAEGSATFPLRLSTASAPIDVSLDATSPLMPEGLHIRLDGSTLGNSVTLRLLNPDTTLPYVTLEGTLVPTASGLLPDWTPDDLPGVNVLSVNGDSLRQLMKDVAWPLMGGIFDVVVAAPAPAVQTLMDYAEDSGLIDLLTDALSGGSGY